MGSEGSRRGTWNIAESEPRLASQVGSLAKSGKAQKLENLAG
ncbi:hypothetical protein [Koleobacter methoxysyntrophicus]|nr:hypothetical protein [Koleobacter methoxysyntrophicus]